MGSWGIRVTSDLAVHSGKAQVRLTDLRSFLQYNYPDFITLFPFELLQSDSSAETRRSCSNDANIDLVLGPFYVGRIKGFTSPERRGVKPSGEMMPPHHELLRPPPEHCGRGLTVVDTPSPDRSQK